MKITLLLLFLFIVSGSLQAQSFVTKFRPPASANNLSNRKLYQRNYGAIIGIQRGNITSFEMGAEMHWRKLAFRKPTITGATSNLEYNFGNHVLGYKIGVWKKNGRVNLTYGGNFIYYTDFEGLQRYGIGPAVGFRFAGFHLVNGYNFLAGDNELKDVNTLYMTLRYYFPVQNKFTWDRKTMRRKRERRDAREDRKEQRAKERARGERWDWHKPFRFPKKD